MSDLEDFKQVVSGYCKSEETWWEDLPTEWPPIDRDHIISTLRTAHAPEENIDDLVKKIINKKKQLDNPSKKGTISGTYVPPEKQYES